MLLRPVDPDGEGRTEKDRPEARASVCRICPDPRSVNLRSTPCLRVDQTRFADAVHPALIRRFDKETRGSEDPAPATPPAYSLPGSAIHLHREVGRRRRMSQPTKTHAIHSGIRYVSQRTRSQPPRSLQHNPTSPAPDTCSEQIEIHVVQ